MVETFSVPVLGQTKEAPPSELLIAARCPECGFPVLVHTATPTEPHVAFPLCNHVTDIQDFDIPAYDADRERQAVVELVNYFHGMRSLAAQLLAESQEQTPPQIIEAEGHVVDEEGNSWVQTSFDENGLIGPVLPEDKCSTCFGYGMWPDGSGVPMGPIDASGGKPTAECPECGASQNPRK